VGGQPWRISSHACQTQDGVCSCKRPTEAAFAPTALAETTATLNTCYLLMLKDALPRRHCPLDEEKTTKATTTLVLDRAVHIT